MAINVIFMSAFIRKSDVSAHFPGGCAAFEKQFLLGEGDNNLYCLSSMSGGELDETLDAITATGFDVDAYVAIGDMMHGPIHQVKGIRFIEIPNPDFFSSWRVEADEEACHE